MFLLDLKSKGYSTYRVISDLFDCFIDKRDDINGDNGIDDEGDPQYDFIGDGGLPIGKVDIKGDLLDDTDPLDCLFC